MNFVLELKELSVQAPEGYSADLLAEYEAEYEAVYSAGTETEVSVCPTILVIMDESFADFRVFGSNFNTDIEVTPFLDSLTENTIKGYALSSVFGGNTANSEYEFLTGNTMAFLPGGVVAYQQYLEEETSSLVSVLNLLGYTAYATHPYYSSGWMRTTAYPNLLFSGFSFLEDYPQQNLLREYVSDREMFEQLIARYEESTTGEAPLFLFGVTMQNHGGYTYSGSDFETTVHLEGYSRDYPLAEQYLSLIHETDAALEYLISYFAEVEDPVVILFYGDHLPSVETELYEEIHGGSLSTLDEIQLEYTVPFFLWANYDIEEQTVELTSLNYLSTYLMEVAGLPLSAYQTFLSELSTVIPAINANGYYSLSNGCFLTVDEAEGEEAEALSKYWTIEYNGIFDTAGKSTVFFPLSD